MKFVDKGVENVVTITNGTQLSDVIDVRGGTIVGMFLPSVWLAGDVSFQVSPTKTGTFTTLKDTSNNAIEVATSAGFAAHTIEPVKLVGFQFFKINSSIVQTSDSAIILQIRVAE